MKEMNYGDILDKIENYMEDGKNISFYLNGGDVANLEAYITLDLGIEENEELQYDGIIDDYKIYCLSIDYLDGEFKYVLEEAYLNGTFLYNECDDVFIDIDLNFREDDLNKRLAGNKFYFKMINGCKKYTMKQMV